MKNLNQKHFVQYSTCQKLSHNEQTNKMEKHVRFPNMKTTPKEYLYRTFITHNNKLKIVIA